MVSDDVNNKTLEKEGKSSVEEDTVLGLGDKEESNFKVNDHCEKVQQEDDISMTDQDLNAVMKFETKEIKSSEAKLSLTSDMSFKDWASFEDHFEAWKLQNWTHTVLRSTSLNKSTNNNTHKYSHVVIQCVHYGLPRMKTANLIRKNQSYMAKGCTFEVRINLDPVTNQYYFKKLTIEHKNHEVSKEAYMSHPNGRRLSDKEMEKYVADYLIAMKVPREVLIQRIYAETGKHVTGHDLGNCRVRLLKESSKLSDEEMNKYVGEYMINLKISSGKLKWRIFAETGKCVTTKELEDYKLKLENPNRCEVMSNFHWIKPEQEEDIYDLPSDTVATDIAIPIMNMPVEQQDVEMLQEKEEEVKKPIQSRVELTSDMSFKNWASFEAHFSAWKAQNFTHTFVRDSKPNMVGNLDTHKHSQVRILCVYSGANRLATDKSSRQSHMAKGCTFQLVVKLDHVTNEYRFKKLNIEHKNHEVSEEVYKSYSRGRKLMDSEVEDYVSEYLVALNESKSAVRNRIYKETGKVVTLKDLQNYKDKLLRKRRGS